MFTSSAELTERRGAAEPIFETRFAESRVIAWNERVLAQFGAEVARVCVGDDLPRIVACAQAAADAFVETKPLWPCHFNGSIQWHTHGYLTYIDNPT